MCYDGAYSLKFLFDFGTLLLTLYPILAKKLLNEFAISS